MIDTETRETMQQRTNWGDLLETDFQKADSEKDNVRKPDW